MINKMLFFAKLIVILFLAFYSNHSTAQKSNYGFTYDVNCYKIIAEPNKLDSLCEQVSWTFDNKYLFTTRNLQFIANSTGTYDVCMKVINKCTNWDTTICQKVTVTICPCDTVEVSIQAVADSLKCGNYQFYAKPSSNQSQQYSYSWSFIEDRGAATFSSAANPQKQYRSDGQFDARLRVNWTINNKYKCESYTTYPITVKCNLDTPNCSWKNIEIKQTQDCNNFTFEATDLNDSCIQYYWYIDSVEYPGRTVNTTFKYIGYQEVCVQIVNSCTRCDTVICITVYNDCLPANKCKWNNPSFSDSGDCTKFFEANNQNNTNIKYTWEFVGSTGTTNGSGRNVNHAFNRSGNYLVKLKLTDTLNKCDTVISRMVSIKCSTAGITSGHIQDITLYPNPASESFEIQTSQPFTTVTCYTNMGQLVFSGDVKSGEKVNCAQWPAGIYTIKIQTESGSVYRRFVKQL